ncbi:hypothetical protein Y886_30205 [Xanthomonas hyacinthi DSM 19077]|nr:hypothetical protein Y886_30205 [Xanthomonas hyacinthi DSM 19077]
MAMPWMYRRSATLASGRYAMLDDGIGFSLVLWKPAIELWLVRSSSLQRCAAAVGHGRSGGNVARSLKREPAI